MFVGNIMLESLLYQNSLSLQSFRCIALFTLSRSIAQILFHMVCIMVEQGFHGDGSVFLEWQKNNGKILTEFSKKSHDFSIRLGNFYESKYIISTKEKVMQGIEIISNFYNLVSLLILILFIFLYI